MPGNRTRYLPVLGVVMAATGVTILTRWWSYVPGPAAIGWTLRDWRWLGVAMVLISVPLLARLRRTRSDSTGKVQGFPGSVLLSDTGIAMAAAAIAVIGIGTIVFLWQVVSPQAPTDDQAALRVDAVKYGLALTLSGGALAGLLIALRRQHFSEHAHKLAERTQEHAERDAEARRVTDLYAKGVEQVGSDNAAARLGGLYALERVAQENPGLRQTIVNVLCAYLRMPYPVKFSYLRNSDLTTPPHGLPQVQYEDGSSHEPEARRVDAQEELQVRLTAQAILLRHLRDNQDADLPDAEPDMYWPGIEIDLSGATLVNWTCSEVRFSGASFFHGAKFIGPAFFHKVRFELVASFNDCRFTEWVEFRESTFAHSVYFGSSLFADATFVDVTFSLADFGNATFDNALFRETSFKNRAVFERATFRQSAMFDRIRFTSIIYFRGAKFHKNASFSNILFGGETFFSRALFEGPTLLDSLAFVEKVWFDGVTLPVNTSFRGCYVAKPRKDRHDEWPTGWETNFEESDEVWGSLRRIGQSESESENPGATSFPSP